jgi:hypothetical protein
MNLKRMNIRGRFLFNLIFIGVFMLIGILTLIISIVR